MKISVWAKTNSKKEFIKRIDQPTLDFGKKQKNINEFIIAIKEPPIKGRANIAIIKVLSKYFKVPKSNVKIINGLASKNKIIKIDQTKNV